MFIYAALFIFARHIRLPFFAAADIRQGFRSRHFSMRLPIFHYA